MNRQRVGSVVAGVLVVLTAGCTQTGKTPSESTPEPTTSVGPSGSAAATPQPDVLVDGPVEVRDGRHLFVRCTGTGSPTLILEGGDEDTSSSYAYAERTLAEVTRTCVYDRANLGGSDPDERRRGLAELLADLEDVVDGAGIPGPFVLVGTSGGGYISAAYAYAHPRQVAGMVFVEVPPPFWDPPAPVLEMTRWNSPVNIESRDYLQVEKDAWAGRRRIGDLPITVISTEYSPTEISLAEFAAEKRGMRSNVENQRGWLVLSPRARQVVVHTGHAVDEADPGFVVEEILRVVRQARAR